ncbi:MAG: RDD family protein [Opitutales bacterium]|nr:RDD family protein [Opitutales bacterium]
MQPVASTNGGSPTPVGFTLRLVAFLFDYVLITVFLFTILTTWILPDFYPGFIMDLETLANEQARLSQAKASTKEILILHGNFMQRHSSALDTINTFYLFTFWIYFSFSEYFLTGTTLGKKMFKLRVVDADTLSEPSPRATFIRNCLKSMAACILFPLLAVSFLLCIFNRRRQTGHDWVARTIVIRDNPASHTSP